MPVAAAVAPLADSVIGAIAGGANKRPPSLSPQQQQAQNSDIAAAEKSATGPATIDPTQQAAIYGNIAASTTGANDALTHALAARGISKSSGVEGAGLIANQAQASSNQNTANLNLSQQALQNQQFNRSLLNNLTQTPNIPGQSTTGAVTAGAAAPLAYALQQQALKQQQPGAAQVNPNVTVDSSGRSSADLGNFS